MGDVEAMFKQGEIDEILLNIGRYQEQKSSTEFTYKARPIIVIAGPTCCGKTELSLFVAEKLGGEIVSADSMQAYRGMDVGTAKATVEERQRIPHHLIDIRHVDDPLTVVDFFEEARRACDNILSRDRVPIVVGGAGFYLHVFLHGPPAGPPANEELRAKLSDEMEDIGIEAMYERLKSQDPDYAATITCNDRQKILRSLEILSATGEKVSALPWKERPLLPDYKFHNWFIHRPREILYERINARCDAMLEAGFVEEVIALDVKGLRKNSSASQAIGYRQCLKYLDSERTKEDYDKFVEEFKQASRRYAKRQFTWFRREPGFAWLDVDIHDTEIAAEIIMKEYQSW
ncbi:MAG: tRNA (adenosine(37)-N6)-dimethylallyltransferase MiaA [Waddliaceae bacterium]|nr:tRNA (adenosine(37)-N6)-dimethylallyltransferase MiaA [Waddliaceae bacterium]MBT3579461.1 tRNA (adenosine(37)-N6)-dimethylallyltransferase MiaA [Waddliaceae bacterium]MBT4444979.1 tRNA (adenosine(37)-N6)-dimethylallyltransferase MiaA [Waddliaceae bacterium]MBT6928960.1 tRNA (adenosine(37)-N6)-dimethylallyltransferase MiaA [Waddliaceae bacterium]MBT7264454.1 tRNA (adenosine(37)-N6)-dimethylallyltransferase MiaA [Waddliaceae bacterium]